MKPDERRTRIACASTLLKEASCILEEAQRHLSFNRRAEERVKQYGLSAWRYAKRLQGGKL